MDIDTTGKIDAFVEQHLNGRAPVGSFGRTLICGSNLYDTQKEDRRKRYPNAIGVDAIAGDGVDWKIDLEDRHTPSALGVFNHIECISVLEHSKRPWLIAQNIKMMLAPHGTVVVSAPFAWRRHAYPSDYFRFTVEGLKELFHGIKVIATAYHYGNEVEPKGKIPAAEIDGVKYIARTEAFLFGEWR